MMLGQVRKWDKPSFEKNLKDFVQNVARYHAKDSERSVRERTIVLGRILQVGWFRKLSNEDIFRYMDNAYAPPKAQQLRRFI